MVHSPRTDIFRTITLLCLLAAPLHMTANPAAENDIRDILKQYITCKNITVRVESLPTAPHTFTQLLIKIDTVDMNHLIADHVTIQYQSPQINLAEMKKSRIFTISSYKNFKIGILVSTESIKKFVDYKAQQYNKKYNKLQIKLTPPYLGFEFSLPADQVSQDVYQILSKFIKNDQIDGYSALKLDVKNNRLTGESTKSIVNHFKLPNAVLQELSQRFNPMLDIPVLLPFRYQLNNIVIQNQYLYLSQ